MTKTHPSNRSSNSSSIEDDTQMIDDMVDDFFKAQPSLNSELSTLEPSETEHAQDPTDVDFTELPRAMTRQPVDEGAVLDAENPVEPASRNMAGFESLAELYRLGKTKGAYARTEAYLDKIPQENREVIKSMMLDLDLNPKDPEMVMLMLWTHYMAAGRTLSVALDAAVSDAVERLSQVVGSADSILEAVREELQHARSLHADFLDESQQQTATIAERVAEVMKASTIAMAEQSSAILDQAKAQAINEIAAKKREAEAHIATITAASLQTLNTLPMTLTEVLKTQLQGQLRESPRNNRPSTFNHTFAWGVAVGGVIVSLAFFILR